MRIYRAAIRTIIIITAALLLTTCGGGRYGRMLNDVESYIRERPDSALAVLDSHSGGKIHSRKLRAKFALLYSMALDKNCIDIVTDSIIAPAVSYYRLHKTGDHYTAAMFYHGRICYNSGDYSKAIISFQEALESTDSPYWESMLYSHLGYTYNKCFCNNEEQTCAELAYEIIKESGDSAAVRQAMSALATAYQNNRMFRHADSLLHILCSADEPFYAAFPQWADLKIKSSLPDYNEISALFEAGIRNGIGMSVEAWCEYAYALYKCGARQQSESIFRQLSQFDDDLHVCIWKEKIAEDEKDYKSALEYEKKSESIADSLVREQLAQSVFKAQSAYYKLASENEAQKRKQSILYAVVAILVLLIITVCIIVNYRYRQRLLEEDVERLGKIADESESMLRLAHENLSGARADLDTTEAKLHELRRLYAKTYQSQFAEIGKMFDYCKSEESLSHEAVRNYKEKTDLIIRELCQGSELQKDFEDRINKDLDNILLKLHSDFPEFKDSDIRFLSYVIVGFDATTRSILLNETTNNMRVKKARLLKKIRNSRTENMNLYSCFLNLDK